MNTGKKNRGTFLVACVLMGTVCTGVVFAYEDRIIDNSVAIIESVVTPLTYVMPDQCYNKAPVKLQVTNYNRYSLPLDPLIHEGSEKNLLIYKEKESAIYQVETLDEKNYTYGSSASLNKVVDYKNSDERGTDFSVNTLMKTEFCKVCLESIIYEIAPNLP